jgi:hypothetical protein
MSILRLGFYSVVGQAYFKARRMNQPIGVTDFSVGYGNVGACSSTRLVGGGSKVVMQPQSGYVSLVFQLLFSHQNQ